MLTPAAGEKKVVLDGGWNLGQFMIQIDYSATASAHPGTDQGASTFIKKHHTETDAIVMESIPMALAAYFAGKPVCAYSANNNCGDVAELKLIN